MPELEHLWLGHVYAGLSVSRKLNDHFSTHLVLESRLWYTTPLYAQLDYTTFGPPLQNFDIVFPYAEGILTFGDKKQCATEVHVGRFEYKYTQSHDLGEYLFRTGCYPTYIQTTFDLPLARINGILASNTLWGILQQDLLLTTMTDVRPYYDFSLTYRANATLLNKALDFGGGVQFDRFISTDKERETSPKLSYTTNGYLNADLDTGYYTFAGTKLMARIALDPKRFFDLPFLGENEGVLYTEAAVLGVKNYPRSNLYDTNSSSNTSNIFGYDTLMHKMPIMFGFTIPTCRIFDCLCIEGEWFGSVYPNQYTTYMNAKPAPMAPSQMISDDAIKNYLHDNWKWALYAKKTLFGGLSIIGQIGRDHFRTETYLKKNQDFEEALVTPDHLYWMLKIKSDL